MKEFSENNNSDVLFNCNPVFINLIPHLNQIFQNNSVILFTKKKLLISEFDFSGSFAPFVFLKDKVVEGNFRMIESYLPELLFAFSVVTDQTDTIANCIKKLSDRNFPYSNPQYSIRYLQYKMVSFIETLLFADIFNKTWNGNTKADRCYVHKNNGKLLYYQYYQIRKPILELLNSISINCTIKSKKSNHCIKIILCLKI